MEKSLLDGDYQIEEIRRAMKEIVNTTRRHFMARRHPNVKSS